MMKEISGFPPIGNCPPLLPHLRRIAGSNWLLMTAAAAGVDLGGFVGTCSGALRV